jgi:hypothetical protein
MPARATAELVATLRAQKSVQEIPSDCSVTSVSYSGDEGASFASSALVYSRECGVRLNHPPAVRPSHASGAPYRCLPKTPWQTPAPSRVINPVAQQTAPQLRCAQQSALATFSERRTANANLSYQRKQWEAPLRRRPWPIISPGRCSVGVPGSSAPIPYPVQSRCGCATQNRPE